MIYLVTRHLGALEWLRNEVGEPFVHYKHIEDFDKLDINDIVMGTLPVHLVADVCRQGARYFHLTLKIPQSLRGQELSVNQLSEWGAKLVEFVAYNPIDDESLLQMADDREDWQ